MARDFQSQLRGQYETPYRELVSQQSRLVDKEIKAMEMDEKFNAERVAVLREFNVGKDILGTWTDEMEQFQKTLMDDNYKGDRAEALRKFHSDFLAKAGEMIGSLSTGQQNVLNSAFETGILKMSEGIQKKELELEATKILNRVKVNSKNYSNMALQGTDEQTMSNMYDSIEDDLDMLLSNGFIEDFEYNAHLSGLGASRDTNFLERTYTQALEIETEDSKEAALAFLDNAQQGYEHASKAGNPAQYRRILNLKRRLKSQLMAEEKEPLKKIDAYEEKETTSINTFLQGNTSLKDYEVDSEALKTQLQNNRKIASPQQRQIIDKKLNDLTFRSNIVKNSGTLPFIEAWVNKGDIDSQAKALSIISGGKAYDKEGNLTEMGIQASVLSDKMLDLYSGYKGINTQEGRMNFIQNINNIIDNEDLAKNGVGMRFSAIVSGVNREILQSLEGDDPETRGFARRAYQAADAMGVTELIENQALSNQIFGAGSYTPNDQQNLQIKNFWTKLLPNAGAAVRFLNYVNHKGIRFFEPGKEPMAYKALTGVLYGLAEGASPSGMHYGATGLNVIMGGPGVSAKGQQEGAAQYGRIQKMLRDYFAEDPNPMRGITMTPDAFIDMKAAKVLGYFSNAGRVGSLEAMGLTAEGLRAEADKSPEFAVLLGDRGGMEQVGNNAVVDSISSGKEGVKSPYVDGAVVHPFKKLFSDTLSMGPGGIGLSNYSYKSPTLYRGIVNIISDSNEAHIFKNPQDIAGRVMLRGNTLMYERDDGAMMPFTTGDDRTPVTFDEKKLQALNNILVGAGYDPSRGLSSEWNDINNAEAGSARVLQFLDFVIKGALRPGKEVADFFGYNRPLNIEESIPGDLPTPIPHNLDLAGVINDTLKSNLSEGQKMKFDANSSQLESDKIAERATGIDDKNAVQMAYDVLLLGLGAGVGGLGVFRTVDLIRKAWNASSKPLKVGEKVSTLFGKMTKSDKVKDKIGKLLKSPQAKFNLKKALYAGAGTHLGKDIFISKLQKANLDFGPVQEKLVNSIAKHVVNSADLREKVQKHVDGIRNGFSAKGLKDADIEFLSNYDGDTATFRIPGLKDYGEVVHRFHGIDTEELSSGSERSVAAKQFVKQQLSDPKNNITFKPLKLGYYSRVIGEIFVNGVSLSKILLDEGLADPYVWKGDKK